jgi:hypothetical protein
MLRAISRKPTSEAYAVRISAQVDVLIVRLTLEETLTQKLLDSKFDSPRSLFLVDFFNLDVRVFLVLQSNHLPSAISCSKQNTIIFIPKPQQLSPNGKMRIDMFTAKSQAAPTLAPSRYSRPASESGSRWFLRERLRLIGGLHHKSHSGRIYRRDSADSPPAARRSNQFRPGG